MLTALGVLNLLFAILGLIPSGISGATVMFQGLAAMPDAPYEIPAFAVMWSVTVCCLVGLAIIGADFLSGRARLAPWFSGLLAFEVVWTVLPGLLWRVWTPEWRPVAMSIAAATGIANGGIMVQWFVFYPVWGIFAARWVKRAIVAGPAGSGETT